MFKRICFIFLLSLMAINISAADGMKQKSLLCTWCHGYDGISLNPEFPNLAGQNEEYLKKALMDLREGRRKNTLMNAVAVGLSDEDISELAAYFSKMKPMAGSND